MGEALRHEGTRAFLENNTMMLESTFWRKEQSLWKGRSRNIGPEPLTAGRTGSVNIACHNSCGQSVSLKLVNQSRRFLLPMLT